VAGAVDIEATPVSTLVLFVIIVPEVAWEVEIEETPVNALS
jgi:hypothetical protein